MLIALSMGGSPVLSSVSYAYAAQTSPEARSAPAAPVEVPSKRTAYATHYRMPDGSYRADLSSQRVRYKKADDSWQAIDSHLVPKLPGVSGNASNDFQVQFGNLGSGTKPVHVAKDGWTFDMEPLFGLAGTQLDMGNEARFSSVAKQTDLVYDTSADGVKETLVLQSAAAPTTFSFKLSFTGLDLRGDDRTGWALYPRGGFTPALSLGALSVQDSAAKPAVAAGARMKVSPTSGGAIITLSLPPSWLADPARVFPVNVDPSVWFGGCADTNVYQGSPGSNYGTLPSIKEGRDSSGYYYEGYLKFDMAQSGLPADAYIDNTTLQLYADAGSAQTMGIGRANGYWSEGSDTNWNNRPNSTQLGTVNIPAAAGWITVSGNTGIRDAVRDWWSDYQYGGGGPYPDNNGLKFYRADTQYVVRALHSRQNSTNPPRLGIGYVQPSVTVSTSRASVHADNSEIVTATVTIATGSTNGAVDDIQDVQLYNAGRSLVDFDWTKLLGGVGEHYNQYFALDGTAGGANGVSTRIGDKVTALTKNWSLTKNGATAYFTFVFKVKDGWGNNPSVPLKADVNIGGYERWCGYGFGGATQSVLPAATTMNYDWSKSSERAGSWWTQPDANHDGIPDAGNETTSSGRGAVNLDWKPVSTASGYHIYLHDGNAFQLVGSTTGANATTWSTAGKYFFPKDSTIASLTSGFTGNPFTAAGTGVDLRDDPSVLYAKMGSGSRAKDTHYRFKVVPFNSAGDAYAPDSASQPEFLATLPNRTLYANPDERHTTRDLGQAADHSVTAELDTGALTLGVTDLSIASWGPPAQLSRTYDSGATGTGTFATGWRYNFEQSIVTTTGFATYTDADGAKHRFVNSGATYIAPQGFAGSLAWNGSNWTLTLTPEHRTLVFNSAGRLTSEADDNGNKTLYEYSGSVLTDIKAANGQKIDLTFSGAQLTRANYAPSGGSGREVDYALGSSTATATYFSGTADAYSVRYTYSGAKLSELYVPSAYFESPGNYAARWGFTYAGGKLGGVHLPGYSEVSTNRAYSFDYASGAATVHCPSDASGGVTEEWRWNADGTTAYHTSPHFAADGIQTWQSWQDPMLQDARETSPLGHETRTLTDRRGNTRAEVNQVGAMTTNTYDSSDRVSVKTDPLGSTTTYTYNGSSADVLSETKLLDNSGTTAGVFYTYNASGIVTQESKTVTNPALPVVTAQYSDFAANGEWRTKSTPGVQRYTGDPGSTITEYRAFDAFGNATSQTDASGTVTVQTAYSTAGRVLTSTDAAGAVTHHLYDTLGHEIESSRTAGSLFTGWSRKTVDPLGRALAETTLVDGGAVDHTVTHTLDSAGLETVSTHSIEGPTTNTYDARGNLTQSTPPAGGSSRSTFDADGRKYEDYAAGAANARVNELDAAGRATKVTEPDGSWTSFTYDAAGKKTSETKPTETGGTTLNTFVYDLGGRLLTQVENVGSSQTGPPLWVPMLTEARTSYTYDLQDRQLSAGLAGQPSSTKTYNILDWVLSAKDADGIQSGSVYDATGRTCQSTLGTSTTTTSYDGAGRATNVGNPDGSSVASRYDVFGRTTEETQTSSAGGTIKHMLTSYDSMGRATGTTDTVSGVTSAHQYPADSSKASTTAVSYAGATTTIAYAGSGLETSRTSVAVGASVTRGNYGRDGSNRTTSWTVGGISQGGTAGYNDTGKMTTQGGYGWSSAGSSYTCDPNTGLKTSESISPAYPSSAWTSSYAYTADGRLATAMIAGASSSYTYDDAGNLTSFASPGATSTLSYDANNRLLNVSPNGSVAATYTYDARGRRTAQGPVTTKTQQTFTYDASDHLIHYHYGSPRSTEATFTYDATGQRMSSVVTSGSVTTTTTYTYAGLSLLSLSATDSVGTSYTITYLDDENSRPYAGVYRGSDSTAPRIFHLIATDRGDVVELLTDSGNAFATYRYDAWGNPITSATMSRDASCSSGSLGAALAASIASRQPLRYAGYVYDGLSGLYYLSARYYDPTTMQFLTKDPAKTNGEDSEYQYCAGNPVGRADPSGLIVVDVPFRMNGKSFLYRVVFYIWKTQWPPGGPSGFLPPLDAFVCAHSRLYASARVQHISMKTDLYEWFEDYEGPFDYGPSTALFPATRIGSRWTSTSNESYLECNVEASHRPLIRFWSPTGWYLETHHYYWNMKSYAVVSDHGWTGHAWVTVTGLSLQNPPTPT